MNAAGTLILPDAAAAAQWLRMRVDGVAGAVGGAASALDGAGGTLRTDSRAVRPGDAFIAWPGLTQDGRRFVPDALRAGAAACLVEAEGVAGFDLDGTGAAGAVAALPGLKAACGAIADAWFGHPGRALKIVAVTGTNGKTSTTWWTAMALRALGQRAGVIGTLGVGEPPFVAATGLTTPDPVLLHRTLRQFVDAGCGACAIEASSIGIVEQRLAALDIDVAVFTNFTRDHLDYHGSMEAYWAAKRRLFDWPGLRAAVIDIDDARGAELAAELQGRPLDLWTVSTRAPARLAAHNLRQDRRGLAFEVREAGEAVLTGAPAGADQSGAHAIGATIATTLAGDYNASNLLAVAAALRALGHPLAAVAAVLSDASPVPGRLQRIAGREVEVVVDYAHTPDALEKVLAALRPLAAARGGRLTCVFGCGGDRDATKRTLMGGIAERGADRVVITSDNPRGESPRAIMEGIRAGMSAPARPVLLIEDRREAIAQAVAAGAPGDVVLIAGKGHEDYQEVGGERRPFSDVQEARAALARRDASVACAPTPRPEGAAA